MWSKASVSEVHSLLCVYYAFKKEPQAPLSFRYLKAPPFIFSSEASYRGIFGAFLTTKPFTLLTLFNPIHCWKKLQIYSPFFLLSTVHTSLMKVFLATSHRFSHGDFTLLEDASQQFSFKGVSLTFCSYIVLLFQVLSSSQKAPECHGDKPGAWT